MQELTGLYDPERPYARFYQAADQVLVQIHTQKIEGLAFGRVGWRISASACKPDGTTIVENGDLHILTGADGKTYTHEVTIQSDSVEDPAAVLDQARRELAQKAANATEIWRSARDLI